MFDAEATDTEGPALVHAGVQGRGRSALQGSRSSRTDLIPAPPRPRSKALRLAARNARKTADGGGEILADDGREREGALVALWLPRLRRRDETPHPAVWSSPSSCSRSTDRVRIVGEEAVGVEPLIGRQETLCIEHAVLSLEGAGGRIQQTERSRAWPSASRRDRYVN